MDEATAPSSEFLLRHVWVGRGMRRAAGWFLQQGGDLAQPGRSDRPSAGRGVPGTPPACKARARLSPPTAGLGAGSAAWGPRAPGSSHRSSARIGPSRRFPGSWAPARAVAASSSPGPAAPAAVASGGAALRAPGTERTPEPGRRPLAGWGGGGGAAAAPSLPASRPASSRARGASALALTSPPGVLLWPLGPHPATSQHHGSPPGAPLLPRPGSARSTPAPTSQVPAPGSVLAQSCCPPSLGKSAPRVAPPELLSPLVQATLPHTCDLPKNPSPSSAGCRPLTQSPHPCLSICRPGCLLPPTPSQPLLLLTPHPVLPPTLTRLPDPSWASRPCPLPPWS